MWCNDEVLEANCNPTGELDARCELVTGEPVCVISCARDKCPLGMTCERVKIEGAEKKLCF